MRANCCCIDCIVCSDAIISLLALDVAVASAGGADTYCLVSSGGGDDDSGS